MLIICISCGRGSGESTPFSPDVVRQTANGSGFIGGVSTVCSEDVVVYEDDWLYVASGPAGIEIFDVSDKSNPFLVNTISSSYAHRVYIYEDHLFLCDGPGGVRVYSLANPSSPTLTFSEDTEWASSAAFHNNMLFLGDYFAGYRMYDITDPGHPSWIKNIEVSRVRDLTFYEETLVVSDAAFGLATYFFFSDTDPACTYCDGTEAANWEDIVAHDGFAIVARNDEATRLQVIYIDDLLRIGLAVERYPARFIDGLTKHEDVLIAACGEDGVLLFDMTNLPFIEQFERIDTDGYSRRAKVFGNYLYTADMDSVFIYDAALLGGGS